MSRRTFEATKAIATAWQLEQDRVKEGQGTRDWTIEQQKDILERGKAYDEDGRAFEDQHMRSAEKYPECQGDPNNIQFLTRDEHFEAHDFNWQNPTNWYFDPVDKVKIDFGDGPIIPCKVITLSDPIVFESLTSNVSDSIKEDKIESNDVRDEISTEGQEKVFIEENKYVPPVKEQKIQYYENSIPRSIPQNTVKDSGILNTIWGGVKKAGSFLYKNRKAIGLGLLAVGGAYAASKVSGSNSSTSDSNSNNNGMNNLNNIIQPPLIEPPVVNEIIPPIEPVKSEPVEEVNNSYENERSSPKEHEVSAHRQRYHTNEGVVWKDIDAYTRGGDDEEE